MRPLALPIAGAVLLAACGDADRLTEPAPEHLLVHSQAVFGLTTWRGT